MSKLTPEQRRRLQAAEQLQSLRLDALLITSLTNVRYLTGFTGSSANLLLYRPGRAVLFTDPRYTVQSKQQVNCKIRIAKGPLTGAIVQEATRTRIGRLGFEPESSNLARYEGFTSTLPSRAKLTAAPEGLIAKLRMVKDAGEIAEIRKAVDLNSQALEKALRRLKAGMTESELAAEIDYQSRKLGASGPAFDTIVAAGKRAALPHARPGKAKIGPGMLLIDMGAFSNGYASDMTRMVHVGAAGAKYRKAYNAVLESQLAAIDAVKPGATADAIDNVARRTLKKFGLDKAFIHSTGHGLGLEIHEPPRLGRSDPFPLEPGMAITIEAGVFFVCWGCIRRGGAGRGAGGGGGGRAPAPGGGGET